MQTTKKINELKALAREYFYAYNWADLEDTMLRLQQVSGAAASKLRTEFEDLIMETHLLDEVGTIGDSQVW